jgi:3-oxoacyl-[acyl-carrier-protein] synthase I
MEPGIAMRAVWVAADVVVSPLADTSVANFEALTSGRSGIAAVTDAALSNATIMAGHIGTLQASRQHTRFEQLCLQAIEAVAGSFALPASRTLLILSTTKGNISLLEENGGTDHKRLHLHEAAQFLAAKAGIDQHLVVSNACISGVMALAVARRFLLAGQYDHALVVGADVLSRFVVSGFQSLAALSDERCRPFDASRKGINLGEAAAAMMVTARPELLKASPRIQILGAGLSNDANHISGPSRTGEELCMAIKDAMRESNVAAADIDFISAHGTATVYNDEMEAKAFNLAGLGHVPLNSLKAYYGHTLGAAGIVEAAMGMHSLLGNRLIPTLGYEHIGVSQPVNIIQQVREVPLKTFLKTASGFGGCNAAMVLQKVN